MKIGGPKSIYQWDDDIINILDRDFLFNLVEIEINSGGYIGGPRKLVSVTAVRFTENNSGGGCQIGYTYYLPDWSDRHERHDSMYIPHLNRRKTNNRISDYIIACVQSYERDNKIEDILNGI